MGLKRAVPAGTLVGTSIFSERGILSWLATLSVPIATGYCGALGMLSERGLPQREYVSDAQGPWGGDTDFETGFGPEAPHFWMWTMSSQAPSMKVLFTDQGRAAGWGMLSGTELQSERCSKGAGPKR